MGREIKRSLKERYDGLLLISFLLGNTRNPEDVTRLGIYRVSYSGNLTSVVGLVRQHGLVTNCKCDQ